MMVVVSVASPSLLLDAKREGVREVLLKLADVAPSAKSDVCRSRKGRSADTQASYDGLLEKVREGKTQNGMAQREASITFEMAHLCVNKYESSECTIAIAELWAP